VFLQSLEHLHCIFVDFRLLHHRLFLQFTALYKKIEWLSKEFIGTQHLLLRTRDHLDVAAKLQ
jgi:hypothetical protein